MNTKHLTLIASFVLLAAGAEANDIYKYTDENGTVHYVDRPTGAPSEERVAFVAQKGNSAAPRGDADGPDWRERREARKDEQRSAEEARQAEAERQKLCEESRSRLESYNQARRLYRENEQGERVYLDEEQIREARQRIADLIEENCSS